MDNAGGNNPFAGIPFGHGGAMLTILRSFVTTGPPPGNNDTVNNPHNDINDEAGMSDDDDMEDLPPLEPINAPAQSVGGAASSTASNPSANDPLPDAHPINPAFATFVPQHPREGSMPDLQSVSDSSDEEDGDSVDEVEMMPDLQPIEEDDHDSTWADEDEDLPPLEPVTGDRRARVEDDQDEDRDRRHPSQRTGGQPQQQPGQGNAPPFFAGINPPRAAAPPGMFELFQTFMGGTGPPRPAGTEGNNNNNNNNANANANPNTNPTANAPPNANANPHAHHHRHVHMPPVQLTFDMGDGTPAFAAPQGFVDLLFPGMGQPPDPNNPGPGPGPVHAFQDLMARLGAMGQAFGFPLMEEEKEDPHRAKKLVRGLEEVTVGLVRRMEKVGGAPGGHVDEATGEVEAPSCAICWDTLLGQVNAGWGNREEATPDAAAETVPAQDDGGEAVAASLPAAVANLNLNSSDQPMADVAEETPPASEPPPAPALNTEDDPPTPTVGSDPPAPTSTPATAPTAEPEEEIDPNKIVCLPCAHVFHAACLVPWFSRPRQTTCPTCRFNIDPENLTYNFTRRMPMPAAAPGVVDPPQAQGAPPGAPAPAPQAPWPEPVEIPILHLEDEEDDGFDAQIDAFLDANPAIMTEAFARAGLPPPAPTPPQVPPLQRPPLPPGVVAIFGAPINLNGANGMPPTMRAQHFAPMQGAAGPGAGAGPGGMNVQMMGGFVGMGPPRFQQAQGPAPPPPPPPQQQQPAQAQGAPSPPPPGAGPGPGVHFHQNQMFTVDFTLFANSPFEGNGVRRQTNVFANQIFGADGTPLGPAPTPGAVPNPRNANAVPATPVNAAPGAAAPGAIPGGVPRAQPVPFTFAPFGPFRTAMPAGGPHGPPPHPTARPQPRERKQWTPPPPPGPSLRSRVEQREREVGLRCSDTSCGIGPSDEDPFPAFSAATLKQLSIHPLSTSTAPGTSVCAHSFHPACLVSAERVAGWGGEDKEEQDVEVSCPSCRALGCVSREEWEEGVRGLA